MKQYNTNELYFGMFSQIIDINKNTKYFDSKLNIFFADKIRIIKCLEITDEYKYEDVLTQERFKGQTIFGGKKNELILYDTRPINTNKHILSQKELMELLTAINIKWQEYIHQFDSLLEEQKPIVIESFPDQQGVTNIRKYMMRDLNDYEIITPKEKAKVLHLVPNKKESN